MARKRKGNKGANNTTDSGSQAVKFSEKNVEKNEQKDSETQEGNASSKDAADDQRKLIDTVEIATDTPAATPSAAMFDKDEESEKTETKTEERQIKPLLKDPKLMDIDVNLQNLDLNASKAKQDSSSDDQCKLNEPQTKEYEKIIDLERNVNLSFEFGKHGTKRLLVDDKVRCVVDEQQKITFNIGDGNAQLSFIGNKASISTKGGQIDCLMQRNRFVFSLADSAIKSDPLGECPRATQVQQRLQDSSEHFLTIVKTTCEDFKNSFLKSLKDRIDDTCEE